MEHPGRGLAEDLQRATLYAADTDSDMQHLAGQVSAYLVRTWSFSQLACLNMQLLERVRRP